MSLQTLFPHTHRWSEIEAFVRRLIDYRLPGTEDGVVLFPWSAGGGFELGAAIGSVPGSSSVLLGSAVLNDRDWSHAKLSGVYEQSCSAEFAVAMAAANFLEIQRIKGPAFNVRRILGLGITATIATSDPNAGRRGGQRACIALRTSEGTRMLVAHFRHSSEYEGPQGEKRKLQSQLIDVLALNLIAEALELPQVPLLREYELTLEAGTLLESAAGLTVASAPIGVWSDGFEGPQLISADGNACSELRLQPQRHTLIPCSANPFSPAHDEMAQHIAASGREPVFVLNLRNAEKGSVAQATLLERARAFCGRWPVLLVDGSGEFLEMAERFGCDFAVGADTALRIFLPQYCERHGGLLNVYSRLKVSGVRFIVFPRLDSNGRLRRVRDIPLAFQDIFTEAPDSISRTSSSEIRAASQVMQ